jgi:hypothetical protein
LRKGRDRESRPNHQLLRTSGAPPERVAERMFGKVDKVLAAG